MLINQIQPYYSKGKHLILSPFRIVGAELAYLDLVESVAYPVPDPTAAYLTAVEYVDPAVAPLLFARGKVSI